MLLEQLIAELQQLKSVTPGLSATGLRQKTTGLPSGVSAGPYLHGGGGLFGVQGAEQEVISTRVQPRGLISALPARSSNLMHPKWYYITGFRAPTGSNPDGVCDDPKTAGPIKNCLMTTAFGRYSFQTREFDISSSGQYEDRGEMFDLTVVNDPVVSNMGGITAPSSGTGGFSFVSEMRERMLEVGVDYQDVLIQQLYTGNPGNNSAGNGYREFMGMDILIGTTKVDAIQGTPCPSLASIVEDFGYSNISASGGGAIVNRLTYMTRMLQWNANRMNFGDVQWAIAMRPTLFMEVTAVWPCAYQTYRCAEQTNSQTQLVVTSNDQLMLRDAMRAGQFLRIDGRDWPVILDDGIVEENNADDNSIVPGSFASDIYIIPLTIRGGFAATYLEYFDFSGPNAAMSQAREAGYDNAFWSDGGRYLWVRKPQINWCIQLSSIVMPRLIMLTPHLAARLTDVQYSPLMHERDPLFGADYHVDGGVQSRSAPLLYSDYSSTTPVVL